MRQFSSATDMTSRFAALATLSLIPGAKRDAALDSFYRAYEKDPLVLDKWFALQAMIPESDTLARVRRLMEHPAFSLANPNRLRSLVGTFSTANPTQFNAPDGSGYDFLVDLVAKMDSRNPQVAARLLIAFKTWRNLESGRRTKAEAALRRIQAIAQLSPDVRDIVERSLA
jgi:aminopeptidase N